MNEVLNLKKKCGISSWVLMRKKKEFRFTYSEMLYPVERENIRIYR